MWNLSHSLSYLCLIQALETLCDSAKDSEPCDEDDCSNNILISSVCEQCDKPIKVGGPTKSFKDFVEKYTLALAGDGSRKNLNNVCNKIYDLRSGLTHGSKLMVMDEDIFGSFDQQTNEERKLYGTAQGLARICLIKWLQDQS